MADGADEMSQTTDPFLEDARLGRRSEALITHEELPHHGRLRRRLREYSLVDLAHAVMLVETGILDRDRGGRLLGGLLTLHEEGAADFPWAPRSGSYLVQAEYRLSALVGEDVAGRLQTGRSRNDQSAACERLWLRDLLLRVAEENLGLERLLVARARDHAATLMPGYTHLQHAQPWSFGHWLMRNAAILERDLQRLAETFARTNLSALGGAANAGTSWPIDRRRVAELLGHDDIVVNACDAGGFARDVLEENAACLSLMMAGLGRLATDLYVWSSWEFGLVEVADGLAGTSSIMPQKKNPHSLERVKALAGQATGWLPTILGCQRGVLSTDLDHCFADDMITPMGDACLDALILARESVDGLVVHRDTMAARAGGHWSTTSHLADELVRRHDLPFRVAHQVVGRFVREAITAGQGPGDADPALLAAAARDLAGIDPGIDSEELRRLLDAAHFLETRRSEGSVHPDAVRAHAEALEVRLGQHAAWIDERRTRVEGAVAGLLDRARELATPSLDCDPTPHARGAR